MKKTVVIGSGFAGLAAATVLHARGHAVTVLEKNPTLGGRARSFVEQGFTFDMGPSWYWMPDVFEAYFKLFGKTAADFYELVQLDPSYAIYFGKDDVLRVPASMKELYEMAERLEAGAGNKLRKFLQEAAFKYEIGMRDLVYKPGRSLLEFVQPRFLQGLFKLHVFTSLHRYVRKYFANPRLIRLLEFPVLFLGAAPWNTPALYSLMNHAGLSLGTWYPMGGMYKIIEAMLSIARNLGVVFAPSTAVDEILIRHDRAVGVRAGGRTYEADVIIGGADYHHVEQALLPAAYRTYDEQYWNSRVLAPSSLIFFLGINKRLPELQHHNLFFDEDLDVHTREIYEHPRWPERPLFYVCCPSRSDASVAPSGCENLFILIPIAADLIDTEATREHYFALVLQRVESITGQKLTDNIVYKRSYCVNDFKQDYHAFKGNAYGLANTLRQTAMLKPALQSRKIKNLFYTGQLTVPGPGVPPSLISGQVVANEVLKAFGT